MTKRKHKRAAQLSKLVVNDGFVWGWATLPEQDVFEVHLLLDGKHVATEMTGLQLPASIQRLCGAPPTPNAGFCFALPVITRDGFPHDVQAALPQVDEGLYGEILTLAGSSTRGEMQQLGRHLNGTVWVTTSKRGPLQLRIATADGRLLYQKKLSPLKTAEPNGYPAAFTVPLRELTGEILHISCNGQMLRGSPLTPRQQIVGVVEHIEQSGIAGWAFDLLDPLQPIELALRVDGKVVRWFRPNTMRPDLSAQLSMTDESMGIAGFHLSPPELLFDGAPHLVEIVAGASGQWLSEGYKWVTWQAAGQRYPRSAKAALPAVGAGFAQPLVSVVILTRNGAKVLEGMLQSWARYNRSVPAELIVIDHASSDDTLALLKRFGKHLDLRVVALKKNDSFSASCNRGAKLARAPHLLFLNNDIEWLQDSLPRMLESLQDPSVGIVGMKLLKVVGESTSGGPVRQRSAALGCALYAK